jgi:hypothetical protein
VERGRRSAGKAWGPGRPGRVCEGRRRRPRRGGGRERGREGLPARRAAGEEQSRSPRSPPAGRGAPATPPTRAAWSALAVSNAPARPGKEEDGTALPARAPPLRPREFPAPPRGAAPRSGSRGKRSVLHWVKGPSQAAARQPGRSADLSIAAGDWRWGEN